MDYKLGELFCGAGGMALGASLAGFTLAWGIDNNRCACETHKKNLEGEVICTDVRKIDFKTLPKVDCLAFGFPCNDFSIIGSKKGFQGKYGLLYKECVRALQDLQPTTFVAENVERLTCMKKGALIAQIVKDFEAAGYKVYYKVLHFEFLGIPQKRHRVIFVGVRNDLAAVPTFPKESEIAEPCKNALDKPFAPSVKNNEPSKTSEKDKIIFPLILPGKNYKSVYGKEGVPNIHCGETFTPSKYRRLKADAPAPTCIANFNESRFIHYKEDRWLTNRESARLQSFPDTFEFVGSINQVHSQIGMAVPPQGIKLVFENVKEILSTQWK